MLNSAENEICSAYKKLNTTNLKIFLQNRAEHEIFPANKILKCQQLAFQFLLAGKNSCSIELSMKKVL